MVGALPRRDERSNIRIDWLHADRSFGFAIGSFDFARVGEGHFAAVGGLDVVVGHAPVLGVGDCACGLCLDVEVVKLEVDQRSVGIGGDREGFFCAGSLDVPNVNVGEVRETLILGDRRSEGNPIRWNRLRVGTLG